MASHSNVLAWRIPGMGEPGGLQSMGSQESDTTWQLNYHHLAPMGTLFFTKEAKIFNGAKTASSISGAGKTGQLHVKE